MADFRGFHGQKNNYGHSAGIAKTPAIIAARLVKLAGMSGSQHDAEALAAIRKAHQLLRQHNLTWADVLLPPESPCAVSRDSDEPLTWSDAVTFCAAHTYRLTERDAAFIAILADYTDEPSQAGRSLHITETVEAEAMPAGILRALLRDAIEALLPTDALAVSKIAEESERDFLLTLAENMRGEGPG